VTAACDACLRRAWLLAQLVGRVEHQRHARPGALTALLALADDELMSAVGAPPELTMAHARFDARAARAACVAAGLDAVCRHDDRFPDPLRVLPDAPAALHVAGGLERFADLTRADRVAVAVVGARRGTRYGLEVARSLGRGLAAADVVVVSGLALGVDSAAHAGALDGSGPTIAVLAGGADRPYPPSKRALYQQVRGRGCVVSEMPPGAVAHRWCFPARNRIIAGLARLTVVVEAAERSGSLITAELARDIGRDVAAVPGHVTSPMSGGTNALLKDGAALVRTAEDVLDLACGVGSWRRRPVGDRVPEHLADLLADVARGRTTLEALVTGGRAVADVLAGLGELELLGHVRAAAGGRYVVAG
jgi:DNA processing protein